MVGSHACLQMKGRILVDLWDMRQVFIRSPAVRRIMLHRYASHILIPEETAVQLATTGSGGAPGPRKPESKQHDAGYVAVGPARPQGSDSSIVAFLEHPGTPYSIHTESIPSLFLTKASILPMGRLARACTREWYQGTFIVELALGLTAQLIGSCVLPAVQDVFHRAQTFCLPELLRCLGLYDIALCAGHASPVSVASGICGYQRAIQSFTRANGIVLFIWHTTEGSASRRQCRCPSQPCRRCWVGACSFGAGPDRLYQGGGADLEAYHQALSAKTNPAVDQRPRRIAQHGTQSVVKLLPTIQLCRRLIAEVSLESAVPLKFCGSSVPQHPDSAD